MIDQTLTLESSKTFGDLLKFLRRRERLTQLELSIDVGYSETQITRLEKNQRRPDIAAIKALFIPALHIEDEPEIIARFLELAESARQEEAPVQGVPPYKGLLYFEETDAKSFFGRENLTAHLVNRLTDLSLNLDFRFLSVVGASGSGKSSLVRAGLAVALRQAGWEVRIFTPGVDPLSGLEAILDSLDTDSPKKLLILVDQFEETFTLCREESERSLFVDKLLDLAHEPSGNISVVIALRADFYSHCAQYPFLRQLLAAEQEYIGQMSLEELRRAVEEPARLGGWDFEPGLVELILTDIGAQGISEPEPGALPLLSHALLATWERRRGHTLTLGGYRASGGVRGAIAETAESVFTDQLNHTQQELARDVFLRLTELGEGTEDTRRRAMLNELVRQSVEATQLRGVLNTLAEARLITLNEDSAEVSHEALIREWQRLRRWLTQDRESLLLHRHLTDSAYGWEGRHHDPAELYRGARLAQAREWSVANEQRLNVVEQAFLTASIQQEEQETFEREAQRQRELQAAQKLADTERQSAVRLRWRNKIITAIGAAALVMAALAVLFGISSSRNASQAQENLGLANQQRSAAQLAQSTAVAARGEAEMLASQRSRDAQVNQSLALAAQSRLALRADNLDLALALALEAVRILDPPGPAQLALSEAAYAPGVIRQFIGHEAVIGRVAVSPDGRYGLSGDDAGVIFLWDLETGEALRRWQGHTKQITGLTFTPDGRHALSGSLDKTVMYWDLETGKSILQMSGHQTGVNTVAINPDGRLAASGSGSVTDFSTEDNSVRLWDLQSGQEIQRFTIFTNAVTDVRFTPDGQKLAVATKEDGLVLLDIRTGKALLRPGDTGWQTRVAISPDGQVFLTSEGYGFNLWDVQSGTSRRRLSEGINAGISGLAISPDGKRTLTGSITVIEWDLETGEQLHKFNLGSYTNDIAYTPGGATALAGSDDKILRLLAVRSGAEIGRLPHGSNHIRGAVYSLGGKRVYTDDTVILSAWDLDSGKEIWSGSNNTGFWELALSPDGRQILASDLVETASLWDADSGKLIQRLQSDGSLEGVASIIYSVAFHPNGKFALTASDDSPYLIYWDLGTGKPVWLLDDHCVIGAAISPDGHSALSGGGCTEFKVKWWDLDTGELKRSLEGHNNYVWSVVFVDDRSAISASEDGTMILWDLEKGIPLHSFLGHTGGIKKVVLSPDKRMALSASRDGTAILWDVQTGEALRLYSGHTDELMTAAWHPNGKEVLTGARDRQAIRWRVDPDLESLIKWVFQNRYVRPLTCAEREAYRIEPICESGIAAAAAITPAPTILTQTALLPALPYPTAVAVETAPEPPAAEAAGAAVRGINQGLLPAGRGQAWEYAGTAGERLSIFAVAEKPANRIWGIDRQREAGLLDPTLRLYAPDGSLLASSDDLENGVATDAYIEEVVLPQSGVHKIEVRSYRDQTGGSYRLILADPRPRILRTNLPGMQGLAISPDGRTALSAKDADIYEDQTPDNRLRVWDLATGTVIRYLEGHAAASTAITISPDGQRALSADLNGRVSLWELVKGTELQHYENSGSTVEDILFHPDGRSMFTAGADRLVTWQDLETGKVMQTYTGHEDRILDIALSPEGEMLYSTSEDSTVRVWNVASGEMIASYRPFRDAVISSLALSPDGSRLLVGGWSGSDAVPGGTIVLMDAITGKTLSTLEIHTARVESIAFSPDGRYALSGGDDKTVCLWELNSGKLLAVFAGHTGNVLNVAFSPDGLTGYSTSADGSMRVWDLHWYISGTD